MKTELTLLITEIKLNITRCENSGRRILRAAKIPGDENSIQRNFHEAKLAVAKFPAAKLPSLNPINHFIYLFQ